MKKQNHTATVSIVLLMLLVAFPQVSETIFTPALSAIGVNFGVSMSQAQLTMSIYFLAFAVGGFFWGWLSDKLGRRAAMLHGIFIYGLGSFFCLISKNFTFLLIARFIQAFGASTGSITTQTILREHFDGQRRHELFAQISAVLAFTPAIGPLIGGYATQYFGFRSVFLILVGMAALLYLYTFLRLPETADLETLQSPKVLPLAKKMALDKRLLIFALLIGVLNGIIFSYHAEAPAIFMSLFKLTPSQYGLMGILVSSATIVGALLSKYLLSKFQATQIIIFGLMLSIFGNLVFIGTALLFAQSMVLVCVAIFIVLAGVSMTLPNCLSLALVDYQDVVGTAGALFSLVYYIFVSTITFGMSKFHNGTLWAMPVYFLLLTCMLLILTQSKKFKS